jgi:hypothetical protein
MYFRSRVRVSKNGVPGPTPGAGGPEATRRRQPRRFYLTTALRDATVMGSAPSPVRPTPVVDPGGRLLVKGLDVAVLCLSCEFQPAPGSDP